MTNQDSITLNNIVDFIQNNSDKNIKIDLIENDIKNNVEEGIIDINIITKNDNNTDDSNLINLKLIAKLLNYNCKDSFELQLTSSFSLDNDQTNLYKTLNDKDKIIIYEELNSIIPGGNIIFTNKKDNNDNIIVCYISKIMLPLEKTYEYINNYILVQRPLNCYMIGNILNSYFNTLLENSNTITYVDLNSVHESIKDKLDNVYDKTTCILDILKNNLIIKNNTIVFDCKDFLNSNNKVFIYAIALNNLKKLLNKNKFYIYDSSLTMISDNDKSYLYNVLYHAIYSENFNIEEAVTKSIDTNKLLENQTFVNSIVNKNNNSL